MLEEPSEIVVAERHRVPVVPASPQWKRTHESSVNAMPAFVACRLAHSCPFTQTLIGYGKYAQIFT